ncbi:hypothetical protein [Algiphilus sp.]|uniref:hypothetical protein n=1 Tax=Algiphilus sp. TaxID=1872431 RepID=UPI003BA84874
MNNENKDQKCITDGAATSLARIRELVGSYSHSETDMVVEGVIEAHNGGSINAVAAYQTLKNPSGVYSVFWELYRVFNKALPRLNAPVIDVMQCVMHLYAESGNDMAAGCVLQSFIGFCENDSERPAEGLQEVERAGADFTVLLPSVLIAGSNLDAAHYQSEAIRLTADDRLDIRRAAIFALGRINWADDLAVLTALESCVGEEDDDALMGNVVRTGCNLLTEAQAEDSRIAVLLQQALGKGGDRTLHSSAHMLSVALDDLIHREASLAVLMSHLTNVNPEHTATVRMIDLAVKGLIARSQRDRAFALLEALLPKLAVGQFDEAFPGTASRLGEDVALLGSLATRWFLSGEGSLCRAIHDVIARRWERPILLEVDNAELPESDPVALEFVARKAIGWLFIAPLSTASMVVSLMRLASPEDLQSFANLLHAPLLLNYPGLRERFLKDAARNAPEPVGKAIQAALDANAQYLEGLRGFDPLPELQPSEAQREAQRRRIARQASEGFERARAQSPLLSVVTQTNLLYGRRSVSFFYGPDDQPTRNEIALQSHEFGMEMPRMQKIDAFGMDYELRCFRVEQRVAS